MKRLTLGTLVLGMCLFWVSTAHAQTGFIPVFIDDFGTEGSSNIFQTPDGWINIEISTTRPNPILRLNNLGDGAGLSVSTGPGSGSGIDVSSSAISGQAISARCVGRPGDDCEGIIAVGTNIGVQAVGTRIGVDASGGALAGRFFGNVQVTGTLTKGGGSFKIDHPLDPANKYLFHSFIESPDMKNVYDGIIVLDSRGEAWVTLPDWFEGLNRDFRYQLTAIGAPAPNLYIAKEVSRNRFKIAGGKWGGKVSWQVTGIRQDAYANAHRVQVEEDKPSEERGY